MDMKKKKIIFICSILLLIISIVYKIVIYQILPEQIPIHYGVDGKPDDFASKQSIWILTVVSILIFALLNLTASQAKEGFPLLNASEYVKKQPEIAVLYLQSMAFCCLLLFTYIDYITIQISLGNEVSLGIGFFILLVLLFATVVFFEWYARRTYKKRK